MLIQTGGRCTGGSTGTNALQAFKASKMDPLALHHSHTKNTKKKRYLEALLSDLVTQYEGWLATDDEGPQQGCVKHAHRLINKARALSLTSPALRPLLAWTHWHLIMVSHLKGRERAGASGAGIVDGAGVVGGCVSGCTALGRPVESKGGGLYV